MNCRNFGKFDWFKPSRLAWNTPPATPGEGGAAAPKEDAPKPEDAAAKAVREANAARASQAEGAARVAAVRQDDPAKGAQAELLLAQALETVPAAVQDGGQTVEALTSPPTPETVTKFIEKYNPKLSPVLEKMFAIFRAKTNEEIKPEQIMAVISEAETLEKSIPAEDLKILKWIVEGEATDLELSDFEKKYTENGNLKLPAIGKDLKGIFEEKFDLGKFRLAQVWLSYIRKHPEILGKTTGETPIKPELAQQLESRLTYIKKTVREQKIAGVLTKYKSKFDEFLKAGGNDDEAKVELLDGMEEKDKALVQFLIEEAPTQEEKDALSKKLGGKPTSKQIYDIYAGEQTNFREKMVAAALVSDEDLQVLSQDPKVDQKDLDMLREFRNGFKKPGEGGESALEEATKAGGFIALFEKLMEKLTALFEKLGLKLDKMFKDKEGKQGPRFEKSPLGGDKKFTHKKWEKGKGVTLDVPTDADGLYAVESGTLHIEGFTMTITRDNGMKIKYHNVHPVAGMIDGKKIEAGTKIATAAFAHSPFAPVALQLLDEKNEEHDPTKFLAVFNESAPAEEAAADATPAGTSETAPATAGAAAAPGGNTPGATPTTPPQTPQESAEAADLKQQYLHGVAEALKPHAGESYDLTTRALDFNLPYIDGDRISSTPCEIFQNTITFGGTTGKHYNIELTNGATLQSIEIEPEADTTKIVAGRLFFSDSREIPLTELLKHLEELRKGTPEYSFKLGADKIIFHPYG